MRPNIFLQAKLISLRLLSSSRKNESSYLLSFPFSLYFDFIYRRKPSSKAKYMLEAVNVDAASKSDDWTPPPARYCLSFFVFR